MEDLGRSPVCLIVPGLGGSGPTHWQSLWIAGRRECERVELGCWDHPNRNVWLSRLDQAIRAADAPVILVAHSLGCLAVAWWAGLLGEDTPGNVRGALLVAPPDVDRAGADPRITAFAPTPRVALPFPAIVVASTDDPYATPERSEEMAATWFAECVVLEGLGHLNAASGIGDWPQGQQLLARLIDGERPARSRLPAAPQRLAVTKPVLVSRA